MTASFETSCRVGNGSLSRLRAERFRALLLVVMAEQAAEFERHADTLAMLTANSRERTTDRDRAIAALRMFSAREALERIEDALVRIDDGSYAICESCGRPIALDHLEAIPTAQLCAACGTDSVTARGPSGALALELAVDGPR